MLTPSQIAVAPKAISMLSTEYSFPTQQREGNVPVEARNYTWGSVQTYDFSGRPYDSQGDYYDWYNLYHRLFKFFLRVR